MTPYVQVLAALTGVLLLAWGGLRWWRLRGLPGASGARLGVVSACAVDPRRRLVILRCDGREALVLTGPTGDQFLGWLP